MSDYRIFENAGFEKWLKKLPVSEADTICRKLRERVYPQLRGDPFYGPNIKKLRGYTPDTWRYRIGRFRVFYEVDEIEKIVSVLAAHLRRDAYK